MEFQALAWILGLQESKKYSFFFLRHLLSKEDIGIELCYNVIKASLNVIAKYLDSIRKK